MYIYIYIYGGRRFFSGVRNTYKGAFLLTVVHFYHGRMAGAWLAHGGRMAYSNIKTYSIFFQIYICINKKIMYIYTGIYIYKRYINIFENI